MAKLLLAEDENHIAHLMKIWLTRHGHEVFHVTNGHDALKILRKHKGEIEMIISDMNMPGMNGLELAEVVRERLDLRFPFMLLTARCDQSNLADQLERFDVELYPKPFMPSRLVADIARMLTATAGTG